MRTLSILTAAAIGLASSYGFANAQATNVAPQPGTAKSLSGSGTDTMDPKGMVKGKTDNKGMAKDKTKPSTTTGQSQDRAKPASPPSGSGGANQSNR